MVGSGSLRLQFFFSIKSCYKMQQVMKFGEASDVEREFWNGLWQAKVPPKVKDLAWRAASGFLPTKLKLHLRHIPVDVCCPMCVALCVRKRESPLFTV